MKTRVVTLKDKNGRRQRGVAGALAWEAYLLEPLDRDATNNPMDWWHLEELEERRGELSLYVALRRNPGGPMPDYNPFAY
jgi:hypothetical protein